MHLHKSSKTTLLFLRMAQLPLSFISPGPVASLQPLQVCVSHSMPHTCTATYIPRVATETIHLGLSGAPTYLHFTALAPASSCTRTLSWVICLDYISAHSCHCCLQTAQIPEGPLTSRVLRAGQVSPRENKVPSPTTTPNIQKSEPFGETYLFQSADSFSMRP